MRSNCITDDLIEADTAKTINLHVNFMPLKNSSQQKNITKHHREKR